VESGEFGERKFFSRFFGGFGSWLSGGLILRSLLRLRLGG
jgi:hypothetical protein